MRKKFRKILAVFVCVALFFSVVTTAYASGYGLLNHVIDTPIAFVPHSGFNSTSVAHMDEAIGKWNTAIGEYAMFIVYSWTHLEATGYPNKDGLNYIYRMDVGEDYLAQCYFWWNGLTGKLTQCDININMYYSWANGAVQNSYDLYSVFLHETGHTAGLADIYDDAYQSVVMYGYSDPNTMKRNLTSYDIAGINELYH